MEILYIKEAIAMKLQFSIKRLDEISIHIFGLANEINAIQPEWYLCINKDDYFYGVLSNFGKHIHFTEILKTWKIYNLKKL